MAHGTGQALLVGDGGDTRSVHTAGTVLQSHDLLLDPSPRGSASVTALWKRAFEAPRSVTRATRRLTHTATLTANIAASLRRIEGLQARGLDADSERLRFQQWLAGNLCTIHGIQVVLDLRPGQAARLDQPAVLVANHISYIDPLAILAQLPAFSIAKKEVSQWPLLGQVAVQLGMIPYRRGDVFDGARVLRRCEAALRRGHRVLAFPEGSTTLGFGVSRFHRGVFRLAQRCNVPVIPIAIRYHGPEAAWVGDAMFVPHYMRTTMRSVTRGRLAVLDALEPHRFPTARALADAARCSIASALLPS